MDVEWFATPVELTEREYSSEKKTGEEHIDSNNPGHRKKADAGNKNNRASETGLAGKPFSPEIKKKNAAEKGNQGVRKPERPLVEPKEFIGCRRHPVQEGRFLEVPHVIEVRNQVISLFHHFPWNLGVPPFVRVLE